MEAYRSGSEAAENGASLSSNPHGGRLRMQQARRNEWTRGWLAQHRRSRGDVN